MRAQDGVGIRKGAGKRRQMVGARGFEPPTSSSRTMRATKLRHAPTEVLVQQSHGIVARDAGSRHRPDRAATRGRAGGARCRRPGIDAASRPIGAAAHHLGGLPRPEVLRNRDPPVRTSHFASGAAPLGSKPAPNGGPRVAREGRTPSTAQRQERRAREITHEAADQSSPLRPGDDVRGPRHVRRPAHQQALVGPPRAARAARIGS